MICTKGLQYRVYISKTTCKQNFKSFGETIFLGKSGSKLSKVAQNSQKWPILSHMVQDNLDFQKQSKNLASFHCPKCTTSNFFLTTCCHFNILQKVWRLLISILSTWSLALCTLMIYNLDRIQTYLLCVGRQEVFRSCP